jgi:uncharacterized phosphosugar-binding protein
MNHLQYPAVAHAILDRIVTTQGDAIDRAVTVVADTIRRDGVVHAFGTGHARLVAHEMAGRAGGLAPVNLVRISDLVTRGGADPGLLDPLAERDASLARPLYDLHEPRAEDCFVIVSNSGINAAVVEMARLVHGHGHPIVAITSIAHSTSVPSRHPSGQRLADLASPGDKAGVVVIDTGAPPGDAAVPLGDGLATGATSSLAGIVIVQLITEGVCRALLDAGVTPPLYRSMNLPGTDAGNAGLERRYRRVHPIEA